MKRAIILLLVISVLGMAGVSFFRASCPRRTPVVDVIKRCAPSVVNISTERVVTLGANPRWGSYGNQLDEMLRQHLANTTQQMKLKGVGSGVIVSKDGLIITNAHVVNMASKVYVILNDAVTYEARVAGTSQNDDIAVLEIKPGKALRPIKFADDPIIGETVVSIGNPLGLENSVSAGIISGTNRTFFSQQGQPVFQGLIQTDASINPGSSGGALLNLEGKLVGMNLAVVQSAQSIGFAIPSSRIKAIIKQYYDLTSKSRKTI